MRGFGDTVGKQVPEPEFQPTNWLKAEDCKGLRLMATRANLADTDFGPRAFVTCMLPDEEGTPAAHTEYTLSFTDKSYAYKQLEKVILSESQGSRQYPFTFTVMAWQKRSYMLAEAPIPTQQLAVDARYVGSKSRRLAAEQQKEDPAPQPSVFDQETAYPDQTQQPEANTDDERFWYFKEMEKSGLDYARVADIAGIEQSTVLAWSNDRWEQFFKMYRKQQKLAEKKNGDKI